MFTNILSNSFIKKEISHDVKVFYHDLSLYINSVSGYI